MLITQKQSGNIIYTNALKILAFSFIHSFKLDKQLAKNATSHKKFPDHIANSLTFPWLFQVYKIPWQFQVFHVFQICGNPVIINKHCKWLYSQFQVVFKPLLAVLRTSRISVAEEETWCSVHFKTRLMSAYFNVGYSAVRHAWIFTLWIFTLFAAGQSASWTCIVGSLRDVQLAMTICENTTQKMSAVLADCAIWTSLSSDDRPTDRKHSKNFVSEPIPASK